MKPWPKRPVGQDGAVSMRTRVFELRQRQLGAWPMLGFVANSMRWPFVSLVLLAVIGTIGYATIEHFAVFSALYMTVITLSTVGYSEVHPLDTAGRTFTIVLIIAGFATLVYAAATMTNLFTSGEALDHLKITRGRRMRQQLDDHVIVVGFGRVGQAAAHAIKEMGIRCLVMDKDSSREAIISAAGHVAMIGDATNEQDLAEAGVSRARSLVAAAELDEINLIVTLTARAMVPQLRIVSRVNEPTWRERMLRAGADVAESPYITYGLSLASAASSEVVLDLHRLPRLGLVTEEIEVRAGSGLVGKSLSQLAAAYGGVLIVGLRRAERFQRWHEYEGPVAPGDVLVALGDNESLLGLASASGERD